MKLLRQARLNCKNIIQGIRRSWHYDNQSYSGAISGILVINILLAVVAFGKDILLASYLGTSASADAFLLAFFLPDTVGNNLLAAAIGVACVPVFAHAKEVKPPGYLLRLVSMALVTVGGLSVLLLAAGFLWREAALSLLGSGLPQPVYRLCMRLYILMLPGLIAYPLVTVLTALLQVYHRFVIPALAPVLYNLFFLGGVIYCYQAGFAAEQGVSIIAAAVLGGAGAMLILLCAALACYRMPVIMLCGRNAKLTEWQEMKRDLYNIYKIFGLYLLILCTVQSVLFVERYLAAFIGTGCVAAVNYAYRLAQFPVWVFVLALGTVVYPLLAKAAALKQDAEFKQLLGTTLQYTVMISLPFALVLLVLRVPVITVLFCRGAFTADSVLLTAQILAGYALAIVGQSVNLILLRTMMVIGKMRQMLWAALCAAVINIGADFILVNLCGAAGLGFGAALGAAANTVLGLLILDRAGYFSANDFRSALRSIFPAALPLLFFLFGCRFAWDYFRLGGSICSAYFSLGLAGIGSIVLYGIGLHYCRNRGKCTDGERNGWHA